MNNLNFPYAFLRYCITWSWPDFWPNFSFPSRASRKEISREGISVLGNSERKTFFFLNRKSELSPLSFVDKNNLKVMCYLLKIEEVRMITIVLGNAIQN